jgi:hypothetical protein
VTTNTSITLRETGIADAINNGREYESARNKLNLGRSERHLRRRRAETRALRRLRRSDVAGDPGYVSVIW